MEKQLPLEGISDPANYRALREPFPSVDEANEALRKFSEELYDLRNKYRIADCTTLINVPMVDSKGNEGDAMVVWHFGDSTRKLPMLARAYGEARVEFEEAIRFMETVGQLDKKKHKQTRTQDRD